MAEENSLNGYHVEFFKVDPSVRRTWNHLTENVEYNRTLKRVPIERQMTHNHEANRGTFRVGSVKKNPEKKILGFNLFGTSRIFPSQFQLVSYSRISSRGVRYKKQCGQVGESRRQWSRKKHAKANIGYRRSNIAQQGKYRLCRAQTLGIGTSHFPAFSFRFCLTVLLNTLALLTPSRSSKYAGTAPSGTASSLACLFVRS